MIVTKEMATRIITAATLPFQVAGLTSTGKQTFLIGDHRYIFEASHLIKARETLLTLINSALEKTEEGDIVLSHASTLEALSELEPCIQAYDRRDAATLSVRVRDLQKAIKNDEIQSLSDLEDYLVDAVTPSTMSNRLLAASRDHLSVIPSSGYEQVSALPAPIEDPRLPNDLTLYPGLVLIVGQTGSGKTTQVKRSHIDTIIRLSEPSEAVDNDDRAIHAYGFSDALHLMMVFASLGLHPVVDGGRQLMYEIGGNAMTGGLSGSVFGGITTINNLLAMLGASASMTLNPLVPSDDVADDLAWRLSSSCAGVAFISETVATRLKWVSYRLAKGQSNIQDDRVSTRSSEAISIAPLEMDASSREIPSSMEPDDAGTDVTLRKAIGDDLPSDFDDMISTVRPISF